MEARVDNIIKYEYPFLLKRDSDGNKTDVLFEPDIPDGWCLLFSQFCIDLREVLLKDRQLMNSIYFLEVKEKFGEMRIYLTNSTPEIRELLWKYQIISGYICSRCGLPSKYVTKYHILPFCDVCTEDDTFLAKTEKHSVPHRKSFWLDTYSTKLGRIVKKKVKYKKEWKRYLKLYKENYLYWTTPLLRRVIHNV